MPAHPVTDVISSDMQDILRGLAPTLVTDLAKLSGSTLEELQVTLQLMTMGDRTVLAAYDLLQHTNDGSESWRTLVVKPKLLEVIAAAAIVTATIAADHLVELRDFLQG